ncbi:hypothetical protein ACIP25_09475 [Streptomyces massasporeus]|uniref:hypothetical protein n=1 Tax=Streptomyces massasporeus TaxID=67324 RepID=UPI00380AC47F
MSTTPTDPPSGQPPTRRLLERPARLVAFLGGLVGLVATVIGVVVAWPNDWWPRHPPEPKIFVKDVSNFGSYAIPHSAARLDSPPALVKFNCTKKSGEWIRTLNGVPYRVIIDFVLTTERDESVVVLGLKPHVRRLTGVAMKTNVHDCVGGDGYFGRQAELIVDERPPRFKLFDENGPIERIALNLGKGDAADFHLEAWAKTPREVYEWTVDLELLIGGDPERITISDSGKPFKIVGPLPGTAPTVDLSEKLENGEIYCSDHPRDPSC